MNKENINNFLINKDDSIKDAMRAIDKIGLGIIFVIDENNKLFGLATDGDIRRAILKGISIEEPIEKITNKESIVVSGADKEKDIKKIKEQRSFLAGYSLKVPVIDSQRNIKDIAVIYGSGKSEFLFSDNNLDFRSEGIKKVLIAGGAGYFGSVLSRELLERGYKVGVLDNLAYQDQGIKELFQNNNFEFIKGDIRNISDVTKAISGADAVIHLAAVVGDPACAENPEKTLEINYLATKNIIETCKYFQINRFIFSSTCSVYGQSPFPDQQLSEESELNPVSLYAKTKIKCEDSILEAVDENFSPTIMRMATLYGYSPNMRFDLAVNLLTAKALFDKKITIFGGNQWRPWLHLKDAAKGYVICLEQPINKIKGKIFNLVSENYKLIDIGNIIKSLCSGADIELSSETLDRRDYNVSFKKISDLLGYLPEIKITDGVSEIKEIIDKGIIGDYKDSKYRRA